MDYTHFIFFFTLIKFTSLNLTAKPDPVTAHGEWLQNYWDGQGAIAPKTSIVGTPKPLRANTFSV